MVRTEGPEGKFEEYEIKYTFGVEPLQQYLIAECALDVEWPKGVYSLSHVALSYPPDDQL